MSVFTPITRPELEELLSEYPLGKLVSYEGIESGTVNTNYFITTNKTYVLTIFEALNHTELPYFIELMLHLAHNGVQCAAPISDKNGQVIHSLHGKPCIIISFLEGKSISQPAPRHCETVGAELAKLHIVGKTFKQTRLNPNGPKWWAHQADKLLPMVKPNEQTAIRHELDAYKTINWHALETGVIHADLFKDNILFVDDELVGIIDFYEACNDVLVYDIGMTLNSWCFTPKGEMLPDNLDAFLSSYQNIRRLPDSEKCQLSLIARAAAFRWWLTRLTNIHNPKQGELTQHKNPDELLAVISHHKEHPI